VPLAMLLQSRRIWGSAQNPNALFRAPEIRPHRIIRSWRSNLNSEVCTEADALEFPCTRLSQVRVQRGIFPP